MDIISKKIAVICNYELLPTRVGGMDYFFWLFDKKCKENNIEVDWFFPNIADHGDYSKLHIIESNYENVEHFFTDYIASQKCNYSTIITHFVEVCSPIFRKMKPISNAKIIVVDHNPRPFNGYSFRKKLEKRVKGFLYSKYIDVFVGVSNYSKNQLIKEIGFQIRKKTKVIFNGLDSKKFKQKEQFNCYSNFVIACHLRKDKGIQDVIEVVNQLKTEISLPFKRPPTPTSAGRDAIIKQARKDQTEDHRTSALATPQDRRLILTPGRGSHSANLRRDVCQIF